MANRPSNRIIQVVIAILAILGIYIFGSWLLQFRPESADDGVTDDVSQVAPTSTN